MDHPWALLIVAICGCGDGSHPGPQLEVGVLANITGDNAAKGQTMVDSINLAFEEINRAGGVLKGRPLALYLQDDGTTPEGAQAGYATLLDHGVPLVLGPRT